jgi:hypothetical protein
MLHCTSSIRSVVWPSTKWSFGKTSASCEFLRGGGHLGVQTDPSAPSVTRITDELSKALGL